MGKDLRSHIDVENALSPVLSAASTDHNCTPYDRGASPFCERVEHVVHVGVSGDTLSGSVKLDVILQHGDAADFGDMAAVTDANHVQGSMATIASGIVATIDDAAEDDVIVKIGYKGPKRYSRIVLTKTGTHTNGIPLSALNIGHHPRFMGQNEML